MTYSYNFADRGGRTFRATMIINDPREIAFILAQRCRRSGKMETTAMCGQIQLKLEEIAK